MKSLSTLPGIPSGSTLNRTPKVIMPRKAMDSKGKIQVVNESIPLAQVKEFKHARNRYTETFKGVPSTLLTSSAKFSGQLTKGAFVNMRQATLLVTVNIATSSAQLAPVPYWFNRIEFKARNGSVTIGQIYSDNLMFNLNTMDKDQLETNLQGANMDSDWNPLPAYPAGTTKTFALPLVGYWPSTANLYWQNVQGDLYLDFWPSGNIVVAGTGVVTCTNFRIRIDTDCLVGSDSTVVQQYYASVVDSKRFLEPVIVNKFSQTLTASTKTQIELDNLKGRFAFILILIKQAGATNTNNGSFNYVGLGPTGTIDLEDSGSTSIWGKGSPIEDYYVRQQIFPAHFRTDFAKRKACYVMDFSENILQAYHGIMDGQQYLAGDRYFLALIPGTAGTAEIQTITMSGVPATGTVVFSFRGYQTPPLAYNASIATIQTAVNALVPFAQASPNPISVTLSALLTAGVAPTFTFTDGAGVYLGGDLLYMYPQQGFATAGPVNITATTALTTPGVAGFTTGTYDIFIYGMKYRQISTCKGEISVDDDK